jgi:hypothetical protein
MMRQLPVASCQLPVGEGRRHAAHLKSAIRNPQSKMEGYSFPEVMFAVVVLGIGFIMLAAVFPVALQQTRVAMDETRAGAIAHGAADFLGALAVDPGGGLNPVLPPTGSLGVVAGQVRPLGSTLPAIPEGWAAVRGNMIVADDPRYAWTVMYRRDGDPADPTTWAKTARVFIIAAQTSTRTAFTFDSTGIRDVTAPLGIEAGIGPLPISRSNLFPRYVSVEITYDGTSPTPTTPRGGPDIVWIDTQTPAAPKNFAAAAGEGAFLVMQDHPASDSNQRMYRLSTRRPDLDKSNGRYEAWELMPGYDMNPPVANLTAENMLPGSAAFILGREMNWPGNPGDATGPTFDGPVQDVAGYTTLISIRRAK